MQERLVDRRRCTKAKCVTAVGVAVHAEFYLRQKRRALDTGGGEIGARGETDRQALEFGLGQRGKIDFRVKRLVERGMNLELSETQGVTRGRQARKECDEYRRDDSRGHP